MRLSRNEMCTCVYMTARYPQTVRLSDEAASESRQYSCPAGPDPVPPDTQGGRKRPTRRTGVPLSEAGGRLERAEQSSATRSRGGASRKGGGRPRRGADVVRQDAQPSHPAHFRITEGSPACRI